MRAVKYFISRVEYALKGNGTIKVNQNDLDALQQIIDFYNTNYKNTHLEDALLLFYILQNWKVANINNEKIMLQQQNKKLGIFEIPGAHTTLQKLSMMLNPKKEIIKDITTELRAHQAHNKVPKEKAITGKMVEELLENVLQEAKMNFPMLKDLNKGEVKIIHQTN